MKIDVQLFGSTRVVIDGVARPVTAPRQRAVLARLALQPGAPVSADQLLTDVWGDDLPKGGAKAVAFQVTKLRDLIEPERTGAGQVILTESAGYRLAVEPTDIDLHRYERLIDDARAAQEPDIALELLEQAERLWQGAPLADVDDQPWLSDAVIRLEQVRLLAERATIEARVAGGDHAGVVADLEQLIRRHPLEEGLVADLMRALRAGGRTTEALRAYGELRIRLGDELGIEPSADLRALESELLSGSVASAVPSGAAPIPTAIPAPLTATIGRDAELDALGEALASTRLVTLTGFGGLGKTRLAQDLARRGTAQHADGVWFVDLTPIGQPHLIADTILSVSGHLLPPDDDPTDHLLAQLEDREMLLVLDNCEHLVDAVADLVRRILPVAPQVRVLATSRLALEVPGEVIWTVPPLDAPAAVELFAERARVARHTFRLDPTTRVDVERIVGRVDGIPLAIEMAAARLAVMGLPQLADHLDDRLALLSSSGRRVDAKQQSVAAVIDWSCRLLGPDDQMLLRRLAVCVGGFDLEAAMAIGPAQEKEASLAEILDRLAHLVEAALIVVEDLDGVARYRMLEPVRDHGLGLLTPAQRDEVARAHATHYASVAESMDEPRLKDMLGMVAMGGRELGNLRAAMAWAFDHGAPRIGLSIILRAKNYFYALMMHRENLRWLVLAVDRVDDDSADAQVALALVAIEAFNLGDGPTLAAAAARIETNLEGAPEPWLRSQMLSALSTAYLYSDPVRADRLLTEASEASGLQPERAMALLNNRIEVAWCSGRLADLDTMMQQTEELRKSLPHDSVWPKIDAGVAALRGDWDTVLRVTDEAHDLTPSTEISMWAFRAEALGALGRTDEAMDALGKLAHGPLRVEESWHHFQAPRIIRAKLDIELGELDAAVDRLDAARRTLAHNDERNALGPQVAAMRGVAAQHMGEPETAAQFLGYAQSELSRLGTVLRPSQVPLVEAATAACRSALGAERFDQLASIGASLDVGDLPRTTTRRPASSDTLAAAD